jgi:hypothetical protein
LAPAHSSKTILSGDTIKNSLSWLLLPPSKLFFVGTQLEIVLAGFCLLYQNYS